MKYIILYENFIHLDDDLKSHLVSNIQDDLIDFIDTNIKLDIRIYDYISITIYSDKGPFRLKSNLLNCLKKFISIYKNEYIMDIIYQEFEEDSYNVKGRGNSSKWIQKESTTQEINAILDNLFYKKIKTTIHLYEIY